MPQNKHPNGHPLDHLSPNLMLHVLVVIYGFTPIIGKLISIAALPLVWWRLVISIFALFLYFKFKKFRVEMDSKTAIVITLTGLIVGLHWATLYHAIKVSNVNTAMCGFATMTFFTALLEPLFFKRRISILEVLLGISTLLGLLIISYNDDVQLNGIYYGIIAAITAALFVIFNAKFAQKHHAYNITFYEFIGALLCVSILSVLLGFEPWSMRISPTDIFWLVVLSIVCTVFPFIEATKIGKHVNPFTMGLVNNLEPVYGIFLAFIIFQKSEMMTIHFYIGAAIIISGVFLYPVLRRKTIKQGQL
jgi:drug/metabolite transporter (DMT)-like permease